MNDLYDPIKNIGISKVANACGVSDRAVYKWLKNGFLPKTEFFGKTNYAQTIQTISDGKYKAEDLLNLSKKNLLSS